MSGDEEGLRLGGETPRAIGVLGVTALPSGEEVHSGVFVGQRNSSGAMVFTLGSGSLVGIFVTDLSTVSTLQWQG